MTAAMMAAMHKAGVEAFLAGNQTTTQGNQLLKPTMDGTTKVFTLTASNVKWEVSKGQFVDAMAFNGQIPGPQIDVSYGDHIRFVVENQLDQPTVVHFHGMTVPNAMDGVPYVTQDPIMPGQVLDVRVHRQGPAGDVRLPLALQLDRAGGRGAVRRADRRSRRAGSGRTPR